MQTEFPPANGNASDGAIPPDRTPPAAPGEDFLRELLLHQNRLYAFVVSLLADTHTADDVFQETNLVLWRKANEFKPGTDFLAWASTVAYYQVLTNRKQQQREQLRFDDTIFEMLAEESKQRIANLDDRLAALGHCLDHLDDEKRQLIERRSSGASVQNLASELSRPVGSVSQALYRIRKFLAECVQRRLGVEEHG